MGLVFRESQLGHLQRRHSAMVMITCSGTGFERARKAGAQLRSKSNGTSVTRGGGEAVDLGHRRTLCSGHYRSSSGCLEETRQERLSDTFAHHLM